MPSTSRALGMIGGLPGSLRRTTVGRYGVAVAAVLSVTVLMRFVTLPTDLQALLWPYLFAVTVAVWCGGIGPGIVSTLLAAIIAGGFGVGPNRFLLDLGPDHVVRLVLFVCEGLLISVLFGGRDSEGRSIRRSFLSTGAPNDWRNDNRFRRLVEGIYDYAIVMLDEDGRVLTWTDAAKRLTGFQSDEIIGSPLFPLSRDHFVPGSAHDLHTSGAFPSLLEAAARDGHYLHHLHCVRKNGAHFWAEFSLGALRDDAGRLCGFSAAIRDATKRMQVEAAYRQQTQELAEAGRLKDEFLAIVSHELRTPLNSILGWTQLLRAGRLDDEGRSHALEAVEQSARNQARLIEDLLDVSRIIAGKMRMSIREVRLSEVIKTAIETVRPAADARGIDIRTTLHPVSGRVFGDSNRLQQVVWNLLSNAIKFTPRGGHVLVQLDRTRSHVKLVVKDTGMGITAGFLPHVFDGFRQADGSSTRTHKGLGLGLTIARHLVELHGGTIRAESLGTGRGSTFRISLPMVPTPAATATSGDGVPRQTPAAADGASLDQNGLHVVVVDDDPGTRDMLSAVLSHHGIQTVVAESAAEGLSAVRRTHPDVLISDIEMPGADGYTLIRDIRALNSEQGGRTPALALTAYARTEDHRRALQAGFQMHLAKPIEPDKLVASIIALADQRKKVLGHGQTAGH